MKIVTLYSSYYPERGGIQNVIRHVNEKLSNDGHSNTVICLTDKGSFVKEEINGVEVLRISDKYYHTLYGYSISFKEFFKNNRIIFETADVIHVHGYHSLFSYEVIKLLDKFGYSFKIVFNPHYEGVGFTRINNLLHKPYKYLAKSLFDISEKIICVSNYERDLLINNFRIEKSKIRVIQNGINYKIPKNHIVKYFSNNLKILYVGRLEEYKGIQYLLHSLALLNKNKSLNIEFIIVGQGPFHQDLLDLTSKLKLNNVRFLGNVSNEKLEKLYISSDIFILLSRSESYGLVVAEALVHGLVTIVTKTTALSEFLELNGCIGIDYPPNIDHLSSLLESLVNGKIEIGPFNNQKIRNWDIVSEDYLEIYTDLKNI